MKLQPWNGVDGIDGDNRLEIDDGGKLEKKKLSINVFEIAGYKKPVQSNKCLIFHRSKHLSKHLLTFLRIKVGQLKSF